ncbi:MAG: polysaccharide biosynthesis tyrosine autokinase [Proteobacteria bacterium]|nr:polysaccharide biosynthesis tyrosine autokinase [Pseudomonadota bacterium]
MDKRLNKNFQLSQQRTFSLPDGEEEISLEAIFRTFKRRRGILFSTIFLLMGLTALVVFQLPKEYTADVLLEIEPGTNKVIDPLAILSGLPMDTETILTEIEIIRSRALHQRVVEKLNLTRDPEFNPALTPSILAGLLPFLQDQETPAAARQNEVMFNTIRALGDKLDVSNNGLSRTITISVRSEDPQKAALIVNTLTDEYLNSQLEAKFDELERTSGWLTERLSDLEVKVQSSERAVEEYRKRYGLLTAQGNVTPMVAQISMLNTEIILARSDRAQAEAKLNNIQTLIDSPGGVSSAGDVLANALIQNLKQQEAELLRSLAVNEERYGPKHPVMIQARAELKDLQSKVELEVQKIILAQRSEVEIAHVREQTLMNELTKLESGLAIQNEQEIQLRQLQREANTNQTLYEDFLASFKTVAGQQGIQSTDARVISAAFVPTSPSHPKMPLIFSAALLLSGLIGVGLIFLIEVLDNSFRSLEHLEKATGLNALGIVPEIGDRASSGRILGRRGTGHTATSRKEIEAMQKIAFHAHTDPTSTFAEGIRNISIGIASSDVDDPPRCILVTSAEPWEGKSIFNFSLGLIQAASGRKTIAVDGDLRKPSLHTLLGVERSPGIVDYLNDQATLEEIIHKSEETGLYYITAGSATKQSANLLESKKFSDLLETLKEKFDFITIDSPPLLAVTDSNILASRVDGVVLAVRWGWTRQNLAREAVRRLEKNHVNLVGAMLTRVNLKRHAYYGYGDSNYYYAGYKDYYTTPSSP